MQIEQAVQLPGSRARKRASGSPEPPNWLIGGLAAVYVAAIAALAFLPGATLIQRLAALDGGVCAQLVDHSFFLSGQQLPLCARCTGMYAGFASTVLFLKGAGRLRAASFPGRWAAVSLGLAVLFLAEDGFNSLFTDLRLPHLYEPNNLLRLASGLGTGVAMAAFIIPVANTLVWRGEDNHSTFATLRQLAAMLPVLGLVFVAIALQPAFLLYPVALFSSAGLVVALSLVNLVFVLGVTNRIGRFSGWRQLFPAYSLAVGVAVLELMALFTLKTHLVQTLGVPA